MILKSIILRTKERFLALKILPSCQFVARVYNSVVFGLHSATATSNSIAECQTKVLACTIGSDDAISCEHEMSILRIFISY